MPNFVVTPYPGIRHLLNVMVPMRDGVHLATDLFFPEMEPGETRPVLLQRTPYGKNNVDERIRRYVDAGYIYAKQDCRGRHDSDGTFYPLMNEGPDGYDTIEWLAEQPWSSGRIGTVGGSYDGWTQWSAAREHPPHLTTMSAQVTAGKFGRQEVWDHGVFKLVTLNWLVLTGGGRVLQPTWMSDWAAAFRHLPVAEMPRIIGRDLPAWHDWLDHPALDEYWKAILFTDADFASLNLPVLHLSGWFDGNVPGTAWFYEQMREHSPARDDQLLVLGPWGHVESCADITPRAQGPYDFGADAEVDMGAVRIAWFDRWLKDETPTLPATLQDSHTSRVFVTGANRWRNATDWPLPAVDVWHLHSTGDANHSAGGSLDRNAPQDEPADTYTYDPADPLITSENWDTYGHLTNSAVPKSAPIPHMERILGRPDTLVYTSTALDSPLEIAGNPVAKLWASTDGPDTDWFVWLHDVQPDGTSVEIARGQLRARFHESLEYESLLEPGETYEFTIDLTPIAHEFAAGNQVRVVVSSSSFPRFDRNLNTGEQLGYGTTMRVATNTVLHDANRPSRILLPVG